MHPILSHDESLSLYWTEEVSQRSTSTSRGVFPQQSGCERDLCSLSQVEWTPRCLDSKEGPISLEWLKFRLVFHLTR